jgi:hypothetical protein
MASNANSAKHGQFFVCGKRLKAVKHKNPDPSSCKEYGTYSADNLPYLSVNFGDTTAKSDSYRDSSQFSPPKVKPLFAKGATTGDDTYQYISGFEVEEGGWLFGDVTVSLQAAGKDRLTKKDSTSGKEITTTNLVYEYETAGEGCVLAISDSAWLLREMNGNEFDAPTGKGTKLNRDTTFTIEDGEVKSVKLARTGTHVFTGMTPLDIQVWDGADSTYKTITKIGEEDLNEDGTIPDTLKITYDPYTNLFPGLSGKHNKIPWDADTGTNFDREKHTVPSTQAEAPPRGRQVKIVSKHKDLSGSLVWGDTLRYESRSATMGMRIESYGVVESPLEPFAGTKDALGYNRRTHLTVENRTYTWTHKRFLNSDDLGFLFKVPPHVDSTWYPIEESFLNISGRTFNATSDLFSVVTGATVTWSVKNFQDITDKSVVLNVTRNKEEWESPRFRVCPDKHDYWERLDFSVEVLNGTGKAKIYWGDAKDASISTAYDKLIEGKYPSFGNEWFKHQAFDADYKRKCVDVRVEFDEEYCNVDKSWERPVVDNTIEVRLTNKVTYFGGECSVDEQCVNRNFQGGATKASLSVRASSNSDPNRFTMCHTMMDPHNPVCKECSDDCDCGAGQYCFKADPIITKYKAGKYARGSEQAWAESQIVKHLTCQKKNGLLEPCGSAVAGENDMHDHKYRHKHGDNGDAHWCGEDLWDYKDENRMKELWSGKCVNHMCVECSMEQAHSTCAKYKTCVGGLFKDSHTLDADRNNDFIANSAKLQTDNEMAQAKAATRVDMLTDIMGATLMFVMVSTVATVVSTLLLAGRCASCRNTGDNKVAPQ